jgi:hypothetical protein
VHGYGARAAAAIDSTSSGAIGLTFGHRRDGDRFRVSPMAT